MVLVFVLNALNAAEAEMTRSNLARYAPEWEVELIQRMPAKAMNELLEPYDQPFFLTLQAGDRLRPPFVAELADRLAGLPANAAGLIYNREQGSPLHESPIPEPPPHPLVWRTDAVKLGGEPYMAERELLPFEGYVLHDKMFRLGVGWNWPVAGSSMWEPSRTRKPAWQRVEEEWEWVCPTLEAGRGPAGSPGPIELLKPLESPLITIVICSYNNAEYLLWAIRSVCAQTADVWQLIVVDDASTDDTWTKLQALPQSSRIALIRNPVNKGKSHSLNAALEACGTPWLLELDADDWLPPDCLEKLLPSIRSASPDTACLYGDHCRWTERPRKELVYNGRHPALASWNPESLLEEAAPLAPRCYRTEALRRLGGWAVTALYDGRLYEDFEILLRLAKNGRVRHVPEMLYHRRIRSSSITRRNSDKYAAWREWMLRSTSAAGAEEAPG